MRLRSRPSGRQAKQALNASLTLAPMALPLGVDELGALLRHVPSVKRQPHQLCRGAARPAAVADALSRMSLVCMCAAAPDNHYKVHQNTCRKTLQQQWCLSVLVQGFEPEGKRITHLISICRRFGL